MTKRDTISHSWVEQLVILGAGPAGLAAAAATQSLRPLVLEAGAPAFRRDQRVASELVEGVGGAGLFSDGKFSFWPSATGLWRLRRDLLMDAYRWFSDRCLLVGIEVPPFPDLAVEPPDSASPQKFYTSTYASPEARASLIDQLVVSAPRLEVGTRVVGLSRRGIDWQLDLETGGPVLTQAVLIATGRFGPTLLRRSLPSEALRTLRVEVGVRVEQASHQFFLADHEQLDPKYVWRDEQAGIEWRTFCCCREGLVAETVFDGLVTASGRADCPPTGFSNVGFNVRIRDPEQAELVWQHINRSALRLERSVRVRLGDFIHAVRERQQDALADALGGYAAAWLARGLGSLLQDFPHAGLEDATLIGPTIEGVGMYPRHDPELAAAVPGLWVAGDAAGTFRGLTAALVSGAVAGRAILERATS